jgi:hypothetical protein
MVSAAVVAVVDLIFMALVAEIIPPMAIGVVLTVVGLGLMRVRRKAGIIVLALTAVVLLIGSVPFVVDHIGHPESGVDWMHIVIGTFGRLFVLGVAVEDVAFGQRRRRPDDRGAGARRPRERWPPWRWSPPPPRVETNAETATSRCRSTPRPSPSRSSWVGRRVVHRQLPHLPALVHRRGDRHRRGATGPAGGARADRPPTGTYAVICNVPGHESMTSVLIVE